MNALNWTKYGDYVIIPSYLAMLFILYNRDERDFFVPEDLALAMWQETYGSDEHFIPYVQVNTNHINMKKQFVLSVKKILELMHLYLVATKCFVKIVLTF
ncbi:RING-type domain-containing protein [Aphis craccivora]|uniref:RING-type domain-containing protein n=1 Tax=Aphis craccivora TaxID=307492 RepID=A0A6G0VLV1_APHCR|nr:RING-type domain-containing protein [Aphis craccivora]